MMLGSIIWAVIWSIVRIFTPVPLWVIVGPVILVSIFTLGVLVGIYPGVLFQAIIFAVSAVVVVGVAVAVFSEEDVE
jgi:hypothetical protein